MGNVDRRFAGANIDNLARLQDMIEMNGLPIHGQGVYFRVRYADRFQDILE